ncbi:MAG: hypothetical protein V1903_09245 [Bacteroidota bacterium]
MIKSEKRLKELTTMFGRKNKEAITGAVLLLRQEEPFEGIISLLVSFYNQSDDIPLRKVIEEFFNDIKDHSVRPEVIAEIRKPWKTNTISMLISSCWQSGLDYSDYLTDLARVFLKSDYATAVECMTVISESVNNSNRERKDEIIRIVKDSPLSFTNEKLTLTEELISILKR